MCYSDGGPVAYNPNVCAGITSFTTQFAQVLDCGRNDYFSPAPTAGSWLDTHFNTFDNVFNGDCPTLGSQCGSGVAPAVSGGPAVTGTTRQGKTLTGATGTWTGNPTVSYSWEEEVSGTWQPYANASLSLTLTSANIGRRYRLKVTAAGTETVVARSAPTAAGDRAADPRRHGPAHRQRVTVYRGDTLTTTNGSWNNASTLRLPVAALERLGLGGHRRRDLVSYVLAAADVNYYVRSIVTATSDDGVSRAR